MSSSFRNAPYTKLSYKQNYNGNMICTELAQSTFKIYQWDFQSSSFKVHKSFYKKNN